MGSRERAEALFLSAFGAFTRESKEYAIDEIARALGPSNEEVESQLAPRDARIAELEREIDLLGKRFDMRGNILADMRSALKDAIARAERAESELDEARQRAEAAEGVISQAEAEVNSVLLRLRERLRATRPTTPAREED